MEESKQITSSKAMEQETPIPAKNKVSGTGMLEVQT